MNAQNLSPNSGHSMPPAAPFDPDMATPFPGSRTTSPWMKPKSFARRCERRCWTCFSYFPLTFVYGLTTWAVWVQAHVGFARDNNTWTGRVAPCWSTHDSC